MIWARDFVPDEGMEIPEYFVYFGIFIPHSWSKGSGQIAKGEFLEVPVYKSPGKYRYLYGMDYSFTPPTLTPLAKYFWMKG